MKPKHPFEFDKDAHLSQTPNPEAADEAWVVESHLPRGWWKHPVFDFSGIDLPMPYIWFIYWLITWDEVDTDIWKPISPFPMFRTERIYRGMRIGIQEPVFKFLHISISFLPD